MEVVEMEVVEMEVEVTGRAVVWVAAMEAATAVVTVDEVGMRVATKAVALEVVMVVVRAAVWVAVMEAATVVVTVEEVGMRVATRAVALEVVMAVVRAVVRVVAMEAATEVETAAAREDCRAVATVVEALAEETGQEGSSEQVAGEVAKVGVAMVMVTREGVDATVVAAKVEVAEVAVAVMVAATMARETPVAVKVEEVTAVAVKEMEAVARETGVEGKAGAASEMAKAAAVKETAGVARETAVEGKAQVTEMVDSEELVATAREEIWGVEKAGLKAHTVHTSRRSTRSGGRGCIQCRSKHRPTAHLQYTVALPASCIPTWPPQSSLLQGYLL